MGPNYLEALVAITVGLGLASCGGTDADEERAGRQERVAAYCLYTAQLDAGDQPPTSEQLAELRHLVPVEIQDQAELIVTEFEQHGEELFERELRTDVATALDQVAEFDATNCGRTRDGSGADR